MFDKIRNKREKFKEMETDERMSEKLHERKKSSDERELERFLERERQIQIKQHLAKFRDQEKKKILRSNLMDRSNMFKGKATMLNNNPSFMSNGNVLKGKTTALDNGPLMRNNHNLFKIKQEFPFKH